MTPARARTIRRRLRRADAGELHELYQEVMGADYAGRVTDERARQSIAEALDQLSTTPAADPGESDHEEEGKMSEKTIADLLGEAPPTTTTPAAAETNKPEATKAEEKEEAVSAKKPAKKAPKAAKPAKVAKPKPEKKITILLKNPEIKRDKDGKIIHIVGTCCWKGCTKTRKIHAADAFQVRYCDEHKKEARNLARRKAKK